MGTKAIKILGAIATVGGVLLSVLSSWVNKQEQNAKIDEAVAKAIANLPAKES